LAQPEGAVPHEIQKATSKVPYDFYLLCLDPFYFTIVGFLTQLVLISGVFLCGLVLKMASTRLVIGRGALLAV
jgi:hypothetical protein